MKKIFSLIISFSLILTFSSTALATNNTEKNFYIPSPSEIQATYEQLTTARTSKDAMIESVLSDSSDFSDRPLLQLGVLSSFAESKDDLSILIGGSTNWNCSTVSGLNAHSGLPKAQSQAFNCTYE